jgi:tetratricopeptide (TPR) repeat protein/protocatechuate 3,4-dioxygenase beta subunit
VHCGHLRQMMNYVAIWILTATAMVAPLGAYAQGAAERSATSQGTVQGTVQGFVRDSSGRPLADATVFLQLAADTNTPVAKPAVAHTDSDGAFRFSALRDGSYKLRAGRVGYRNLVIDPVSVALNAITIDIVLVSDVVSDVVSTTAAQVAQKPAAAAVPQKSGAQAPEFFDEPQFTVAGVTQATNSGGHGSDTVIRTTEALAKATASLSKGSASKDSASKDSTISPQPTPATGDETSLRDTLARQPDNFEANRQLGQLLAEKGNSAEALRLLQRASQLNPGSADVHHLLGDVEEKLDNPLQAVRDYQRAAELDPNETNLFDWGAELLAHRALEPAAEVFTKGNRLFPKSSRMLVALGVAWYARGSYDQAAQCLVSASDLDPLDPTPYLFIGRMQSVEIAPLESSVETLARFAQLQPQNALANYYYAVSLWKQTEGGKSPENGGEKSNDRSARIQSLLLKAVRLDPKLSAAYLQLGIIYSERGDIARAISAYREAIAAGSDFDDTLTQTHYRLAQAYLRNGEKDKAKEELELHAALDKKTKQDAERQRLEVQEFVISLRGDNSATTVQH